MKALTAQYETTIKSILFAGIIVCVELAVNLDSFRSMLAGFKI